MKRTKNKDIVPIQDTFKKEIDQLLDEGLSYRKAVFVLEYLKTTDPVIAYINAGLSKPSQDKKDISHAASVLIGQRNIVKAIYHQISSRAERTLITADRVVAELGKIAFADMSELYDDDGELKDLSQVSDAVKQAISEINIKKQYDKHGNHIGTTKIVKMHSKIKSLQLLAKHLGLLQEKIVMEGRVQHLHAHSVKVDYSKLSDEELAVLCKVAGTDDDIETIEYHEEDKK